MCIPEMTTSFVLICKFYGILFFFFASLAITRRWWRPRMEGNISEMRGRSIESWKDRSGCREECGGALPWHPPVLPGKGEGKERDGEGGVTAWGMNCCQMLEEEFFFFFCWNGRWVDDGVQTAMRRGGICGRCKYMKPWPNTCTPVCSHKVSTPSNDKQNNLLLPPSGFIRPPRSLGQVLTIHLITKIESICHQNYILGFVFERSF